MFDKGVVQVVLIGYIVYHYCLSLTVVHVVAGIFYTIAV